MLDLAIDAAEELGCDRIVVVVVGAHSPAGGRARQEAPGRGGHRRAGSAAGHRPRGAGRQARPGRLFDGDVVVTYADCPLLTAATIEPLFDLHDTSADIAVLGFEAADPVALRPADPGRGRGPAPHRRGQGRQRPGEGRAGLQLGRHRRRRGLLFELLARVTNDNAKGEYYLTDVVGLAVNAGLSWGHLAPEEAVMGADSARRAGPGRGGLPGAAARQLMAEGVTS